MSRYWITLSLCSCLALTGCDSSKEFSDYDEAPLSENTDTGHSHAGAHGGEVIEFDAAHAHHAEMVFDAESRDITLYFYGAEVGKAHPAEGLVVELEEGDDEIHLEAAAAPLEGETEETASCYVVAGSQIPEGTKSLHDLEGHFHVTMDGQDFRGSFGHHDHGHDHGEEGHHDDDDHEHGDDDHDGHDEDGDEDHGEEGDDADDGEQAAEEPAEEPAEEEAAEPAEEAAEPAEEASEESTEEPAEEAAEPAEETSEEPADEPAEEAAE